MNSQPLILEPALYIEPQQFEKIGHSLSSLRADKIEKQSKKTNKNKKVPNPQNVHMAETKTRKAKYFYFDFYFLAFIKILD